MECQDRLLRQRCRLLTFDKGLRTTGHYSVYHNGLAEKLSESGPPKNPEAPFVSPLCKLCIDLSS